MSPTFLAMLLVHPVVGWVSTCRKRTIPRTSLQATHRPAVLAHQRPPPPPPPPPRGGGGGGGGGVVGERERLADGWLGDLCEGWFVCDMY